MQQRRSGAAWRAQRRACSSWGCRRQARRLSRRLQQAGRSRRSSRCGRDPGKRLQPGRRSRSTRRLLKVGTASVSGRLHRGRQQAAGLARSRLQQSQWDTEEQLQPARTRHRRQPSGSVGSRRKLPTTNSSGSNSSRSSSSSSGGGGMGLSLLTKHPARRPSSSGSRQRQQHARRPTCRTSSLPTSGEQGCACPQLTGQSRTLPPCHVPQVRLNVFPP